MRLLQLIAVLLVVTGSHSLPRYGEVVEPSNATNMVENVIRWFIEWISMKIEKAGLDPLEFEKRDIEINTENSDLVVKGFVENVQFSGASDIRIHTLEYNYFYKTLRLEVFLPEINFKIGDSGLEIIFYDKKIEGQLKGSLFVKSINVACVGYVQFNINGDITFHILSFDGNIGGIEPDLSVIAQGIDRSEFFNTLLNEKIPNFLKDNKDDIDRILQDILSIILNSIWRYWNLFYY